jgi:Undecaprenyl-phosphate galactose phosphotransferase WbaP
MQQISADYQLVLAHARPGDCANFYARHARAIMSLSLSLADALTLGLSAAAGIALRRLLLGPFDSAFIQWLAPFIALYLLIYAVRGLYPAVGLGFIGELRSLTITTTAVSLVIASLSYITHTTSLVSRLAFALMWLASLVLVPAGRVAMRSLLAYFGWWGEPAAIIGPLEQALRAAERYRASPKIGLRPALIFTPLDHTSLADDLPVYALRAMPHHPDLAHVHTALVLYQSLEELPDLRERYQDTFERVILVRDGDNGLNLCGISVTEYGGLLSFEIRHNLLDRAAQTEKRLMDVIGSGFGLLVITPLLAAAALLIKITSPGPVFYRQPRLGKDGRVLNMLKFRTMHVNADQVLKSFLDSNPHMRAEWDCYQKLRVDPRITPIGAFLRRYSIDELPQLWNVLTGEMSLVGPRPIMLNQAEIYGPTLKHYQRVLPGMTGLWQISGRNQATFAQRAGFDHHYVMNWSIWLDVYILAKTIFVVLKRDGAC